MDLNEARDIINRADEQIVAALKERMRAVTEVARYKQAHNLPVLDEKREEKVLERVQQNGTMYQQIQQMQGQMMMLARMVDSARGSNLAEQLAAQFGTGAPVAPVDGKAPAGAGEALGGDAGGEAENTKKARQRVADSTSPV